jgi:hypothetical protein
MTKQTFIQKSNGDTLSATEWNNLTSYVNTAVDAINAGGSSSAGGSGDSHVSFDSSGKHNLTIGTTASDQYLDGGETKGGKINIEAVSDIQLKPGDDIIMYSHHRAQDKQDEVSVKVTDGNDIPVKLQVNAADIVLTTKDKATKSDELNIAVNSAANTRGYLKVRAQAIDLRCERHGGVALQPKGYDSDGHMNKIKFEHGGGDGLEFGTFNTEKTSIFTDEYRFNKDGVWKMATRQTTDSGKTIQDEKEGGLGVLPATGALKYVKQADDFYDIIAQDDEQCTTKDIIKTAYAMNGGKDRHTKITNKGAIEIATNPTYTIAIEEAPVEPATATAISTISTKIAALDSVTAGDTFNEGDFTALPVAATVYTNGTQYFSFTEVAAPSIKIESGSELKLGGILDFGSSFNFGETDNGIEFQYKLTKKNAEKDCGVLKVVGVNNHATNNLTVEGVTIAPGETATIAQCSVLDIIKLVNYFKTGAGQANGPWASNS